MNWIPKIAWCPGQYHAAMGRMRITALQFEPGESTQAPKEKSLAVLPLRDNLLEVFSRKKYFTLIFSQENAMIRLFVRHPVSDFSNWKKAYDDFDGERGGMGVKAQAVFQSVDDANDVTIWHDFEEMESAQAFLGSARLKEVMEVAGVTGQPTMWFTRSA